MRTLSAHLGVARNDGDARGLPEMQKPVLESTTSRAETLSAINAPVMGYLFVYSACIACRRDFFYNPERVPSIRVDAAGRPSPTGSREPVCPSCMDLWNARRRAAGLDPYPILPGAYDPEEVA
jgi:hypothetical protein